MRAVDVAVVLHVAQERDGLERLAETHLVGKDAVDARLVEGDHPVETADLVVAHLAVLDVRGRGFELGRDGRVRIGVREQLFVFFLLGHAVTVAEIITDQNHNEHQFEP